MTGQPDGQVSSKDDASSEDTESREKIRPEIVIGLVGALGTDLQIVEEALSAALLLVRYDSQTIRVSELIATSFDSLGLELQKEPQTAIDRLMDEGDLLREDGGDGGLAANLAIANISSRRHAWWSSELGKSDQEQVDERPAMASIIRQLKHPAEVQLLRSIYGARFVLLGAWSTREDRLRAVKQRLEDLHPHMPEDDLERHTVRLVRRDEKDGERELGQRVRDTFELADAYVALQPGRPIDDQVKRLVRLLFGDPFETPSREEQAMYHASGARLRSSAGGRQVGAVVIDDDGEVVATGTNDVPKAGGGQYWVGDNPDHRDFQHRYDYNDRQQFRIVTDIIKRLQLHEPSWLSGELVEEDPGELALRAIAAGGPLNESRVADLLEFGRILHAEMAVICTAARRGTALRGLTMYTTTYPCHECARLIIGSGITRVVYIDPYPKSKVPEMYEHEISDGVVSAGKSVEFLPFEGVAPRLFASVFAMTARPKDDEGRFLRWAPERSLPRLMQDSDVWVAIQAMEDSLLGEDQADDDHTETPAGDMDDVDVTVGGG